MERATGKRPPVHDPCVLNLRALATRMPDRPPPSSNWWADIGAWPMLKNDRIGTCGPAAVLHWIQQRRAYANRTYLPSDAEVGRLYTQWTGWDPDDSATDRGTVLSAAMADWATRGVRLDDGSDDKPDAYAVVDHRSIPWIQYGIWKFGAVMLGIECPTAWLTDAEYVLDVPHDGPGEIASGHAMLAVGYDLTANGSQFHVITWGARFVVPQRALAAVTDEAYVILNRDWIDVAGHDPAGIDYAAAEAAMQNLPKVA